MMCLQTYTNPCSEKDGAEEILCLRALGNKELQNVERRVHATTGNGKLARTANTQPIGNTFEILAATTLDACQSVDAVDNIVLVPRHLALVDEKDSREQMIFFFADAVALGHFELLHTARATCEHAEVHRSLFERLDGSDDRAQNRHVAVKSRKSGPKRISLVFSGVRQERGVAGFVVIETIATQERINELLGLGTAGPRLEEQ